MTFEFGKQESLVWPNIGHKIQISPTYNGNNKKNLFSIQ